MREPKFIARVIAEKGLLLGGPKVHESSPMDWRDAVAWADVVIETNKEAGRHPVYDGIRMAKPK